VARLSVLGVPSSAGSYAAGQDLAPAALRNAGLIDQLTSAGLDVVDHGDLPRQAWRPDRSRPLAQNSSDVASCLAELTARLRPIVRAGDRVLVLGGNCTIALSVMAALQAAALQDTDPSRSGLLYFDRHFDLNTPATTTDGALDWMGLAHALALPGCAETVLDAFDRRPLLSPDQIAWVGVQDSVATGWELEQRAQLALRVESSEELALRPGDAVSRALAALPAGALAIHLDVDVLDFTDAPLAENTDGRNTGPSLSQLATGLTVATRDPRMRALSIGELNPTRSAGHPMVISRFVETIVASLTAPSSVEMSA
jgi:arginase